MTEEKTPREVWIIFDEDDGDKIAHTFLLQQDALDVWEKWSQIEGFPEMGSPEYIPPPVRFVEEKK